MLIATGTHWTRSYSYIGAYETANSRKLQETDRPISQRKYITKKEKKQRMLKHDSLHLPPYKHWTAKTPPS